MRPPLFSIFLLSASALSYEILLLRLFSIIQWHHFAYMVISLSLLGYGMSGMFLSLARDWLRPRFAAFYTGNCLLFSLTSVTGFLVGQQIPFNPLEIAWGPHQVIYLLLLYLLLMIPFFTAANCIGLALSQFTKDIPRIYGLDLIGSGVGACAVILLLFLVQPMTALYAISSLGLIATGLGTIAFGFPLRWQALLFAGALSIVPLLHQQNVPLQISPYKNLSQTLKVMGTVVVHEQSSPLGLLTVVRSPAIPFRHAPGISLNTSLIPPDQLAVFTDGEGMNVISRDTKQPGAFAYTDFLTSALPYHLLNRPKVLILGAGGGADVQQARYLGATRIDCVELNPQMADLVTKTYADFSGNLYKKENVHLHIGEARGFVASTRDNYDLIQIALLDAFNASSAGLYALSENYTYTVEALVEYLAHLTTGGILAITRWVKVPPRDALKLFATALSALDRMGVDTPGQQIILIRGWQTSTLLIKNEAFSPQEILTLRRFCADRSFDVCYYPGIRKEEANRYNILVRPFFFEGTFALLNRAVNENFTKRYKFNIEPATDNRPYFFHFFKWSALAEIFALRSRGGLPLLEQGYLVLIATLCQAVLASALLILLPLWYGQRNRTRQTDLRLVQERAWVIVYFFCLGIAFLFIEMAFIQQFILYLRHPLYAAGVVIAGFLLFAGFGSNYCTQLEAKKISEKKILIRTVGVITGLSLIYLPLLPFLFRHLSWLPGPLKGITVLCFIAPLAFTMGIPFPMGLTSLSHRMQELIPWAWGINGCASVISAVLAVLAATHIGFRGVVIFALFLYVLAAVIYPLTGEKSGIST